MTGQTVRTYGALVMGVVLVGGVVAGMLTGRLSGTDAAAVLGVALPVLVGTHASLNRKPEDKE